MCDCNNVVCVNGTIFNVKTMVGIDCRHKDNQDMCLDCEVCKENIPPTNNDDPIIRW